MHYIYSLACFVCRFCLLNVLGTSYKYPFFYIQVKDKIDFVLSTFKFYIEKKRWDKHFFLKKHILNKVFRFLVHCLFCLFDFFHNKYSEKSNLVFSAYVKDFVICCENDFIVYVMIYNNSLKY